MEAESKSSAHHVFVIGEAVSYAWETTKKNLKFLVLSVLIIAVVTWGLSFLRQMVVGQHPQGFESLLGLILSIVSQIVGYMLSIGFLRITLSLLDGHKPQYAFLWDNWNRKLWNVFLGSILFGLIVLAGIILLIIPGIIFALKYQYYIYLIVDKNMGPVEAIKMSGQITKGNLWRLFWLGFVQAGIIILGALALIVGLLVAYPVVMLVNTYVYRKMLGGKIGTPKELAV